MWKHLEIVYIQACSKQGPRGKVGATMGESSFTKKHIEKTIKNILLKNLKLENLILVLMHLQVVYFLVCSNKGYRGRMGQQSRDKVYIGIY